MEDSQIIELYLNRDESAISHTADKYGSMLRSASKRITGDAEEAEDIAQEVFLRLYTYDGAFDSDVDTMCQSVASWISWK